jgi:c-di-GMP-binding flagellar brake protein YcgR
MTEPSPADPLAAFTLTSAANILEKLQTLQRTGTLLSIAWDASGASVTSTLIKLLPQKGLMALETPQHMPAQLCEAALLSFSASVQGADVRFACARLREATLDGQEVLAAPIPAALIWVQRRENYRISLPRAAPVLCRVPLPNDEIAEFEVLNISLLGLALLDKSGRLDYWGRVGQVFGNCALLIDGLREERVSLEIRNKRNTARSQGRSAVTRVGFAFRDISRSFARRLQHYVAALERERARRDA